MLSEAKEVGCGYTDQIEAHEVGDSGLGLLAYALDDTEGHSD